MSSCDLAQRLAAVGRIHLVAAAVALRRGGLGGLAEGAVERRRVLRRVGEDRGVGVALLVELVADRGDPAVHHVAGGDDVGAGLGVRDRGAREQLEGDVVVDLAVAEEPAVPMRRVFAQADVGDHGQVGVRLLQRAHRHLHDALVVVGAGARLVLFGGDPEEDHRADAGGLDLGRLGDQLADREALDARHRLDVLAHVGPRHYEEWLDQVPGRKLRLADEISERLGSPQAAHARRGKAHWHDSRRRGMLAPWRGWRGCLPPRLWRRFWHCRAAAAGSTIKVTRTSDELDGEPRRRLLAARGGPVGEPERAGRRLQGRARPTPRTRSASASTSTR